MIIEAAKSKLTDPVSWFKGQELLWKGWCPVWRPSGQKSLSWRGLLFSHAFNWWEEAHFHYGEQSPDSVYLCVNLTIKKTPQKTWNDVPTKYLGVFWSSQHIKVINRLFFFTNVGSAKNMPSGTCFFGSIFSQCVCASLATSQGLRHAQRHLESRLNLASHHRGTMKLCWMTWPKAWLQSHG